jgi:hypothetical protein
MPSWRLVAPLGFEVGRTGGGLWETFLRRPDRLRLPVLFSVQMPPRWRQHQSRESDIKLCDLAISAIRQVSSSRFHRVQFYTDSDRARRKLAPMASDINIIRVEEDGPDGIIVTFSDRTFGAYVVEELLELRPHRETVRVKSRPTARGKA